MLFTETKKKRIFTPDYKRTMKTEKTTLMDIARRAGLSIGTVDRVLHNRGEVSRKSQEKVMQEVMELRPWILRTLNLSDI